MGYWQQDDEGHSFVESETDPGMTWGDTPADIVGDAINLIKAAFVKDVARLPTKAEIIAGLQFSTNVIDDLPETVAEAEAKGDEVLKGWFDGEPDGYFRDPVTEEAKAFVDAYYNLSDPATLAQHFDSPEFRATALGALRREAEKTVAKVIASLEVVRV